MIMDLDLVCEFPTLTCWNELPILLDSAQEINNLDAMDENNEDFEILEVEFTDEETEETEEKDEW